MDNKGWNGQKASFTEVTSNSEYPHVPLCLFPFPSPPLLWLSIAPSIPQVVLANEMARRLISVTGQWASDCQLNWPCVHVGSLQIQAHSHRLRGPAHWGHPGSPPTAFLCKNRSLSLRINTHIKHKSAQMHPHIPLILHTQRHKAYHETRYMMIWYEDLYDARYISFSCMCLHHATWWSRPSGAF